MRIGDLTVGAVYAHQRTGEYAEMQAVVALHAQRVQRDADRGRPPGFIVGNASGRGLNARGALVLGLGVPRTRELWEWVRQGLPAEEAPVVRDAVDQARPFVERLSTLPGESARITQAEWEAIGAAIVLPQYIRGEFASAYAEYTAVVEAQRVADSQFRQETRQRAATFCEATAMLQEVMPSVTSPTHLQGVVTLSLADYAVMASCIRAARNHTVQR